MDDAKNISILINEKEQKIAENITVLNLIKDLKRFDYIACSVNGKMVDMDSIIHSNDDLKLYTFDDNEGKEVFWHSSSHILGNALTNLYKCKLVNGPATEEGFYYDVETPTPISSEDFEKIEKEMKRIIKENLKFERVIKTKNELLDMYKDNPCKTYFIEKNVEDKTSVYFNMNFFDMCLGPHLNSTGIVKSIKLLKTSSVYFLNDAKNASLQRIYGISFPSKDMMDQYVIRMEKAKEMNHRKIGKEMDLFFFHKYSAGSCFWLPDGAHIYNKLMDLMRDEYKKRGFSEVITPNLFSIDLWKESGHYQNYKDNIYMVEKEDFALKPMNCPGHCLMFRNMERSFRELPIRFADFGVLHRNEITGALSGLTRVRRFQQDDAHIFCQRDQIQSEIEGCLDFLNHIYKIFDFKFDILLSTRPEQFLGSLLEWDEAETALKNALKSCGQPYKIKEGDGAFYGPKLDIILHDALGRKCQCATIQLDFQLPQRFNLKYVTSENKQETPVIIHRAILGSVERMISIILESYGKKLPFWLTPRQIAIVPLYSDEYANEIEASLPGFKVKVLSGTGVSFNKKIRNAQIDGYRLVCVVGRSEVEKREINIRSGNTNFNCKLNEFINFVFDVSSSKKNLEIALNEFKQKTLLSDVSNVLLSN